jgi:hypothetical protein
MTRHKLIGKTVSRTGFVTTVLAVSVPALWVLGVRGAHAADGPVGCAACHVAESHQLTASVHADLQCQDCHGGESSYSVSADAVRVFAQPDPSTGSFDHGDGFLGKPARKDVPDRCGSCHSDVVRMNPFGISTDQLSRYWTSGHGKSLKGGDDRVAVCVDCHGTHDILPAREPASKTHPLNIPQTCGSCHEDAKLMETYELPVEISEEYRQSVHGRLLFEQHDAGAPTCATCHGSHSAMPPGFSSVGDVCAQCHRHAADNFSTSIHAEQEEHKGCVQCHGGGEGRHSHLIERITKPSGLLIQRYAHLLASEPEPSAKRVAEAIHPDPRQIITRALPTCMDCHEDLEDDESLPKLFELLDAISHAERLYAGTGKRLNEAAKGVLLVNRQRFLFEDAKTHLIELAPLQHTLDNEKVSAKVAELNAVCNQVNEELDELERSLLVRRRMLIPIWLFSLVFAALCYAKYKQLKAQYVKPLPRGHAKG